MLGVGGLRRGPVTRWRRREHGLALFEVGAMVLSWIPVHAFALESPAVEICERSLVLGLRNVSSRRRTVASGSCPECSRKRLSRRPARRGRCGVRRSGSHV